MITTRIISTGACVPEQVITNDDLSKIVDTSDEWITQRTGIKRRHISAEYIIFCYKYCKTGA